MSQSDIRQPEADEPLPLISLSMAPFAAVMLALVAVWIAATPNTLHSVDFDMAPDCMGLEPLNEKPASHTVDIAADGAVTWDGHPVPDRTTLEDKMLSVGSQSMDEQGEVYVNPHPEAAYRAVIAVMAAARRNNVKIMGLSGPGFSYHSPMCFNPGPFRI